jgi:hypothetical protein
LRVNPNNNRPVVPNEYTNKQLSRQNKKGSDNNVQMGEGFLPVKSHPIGDEIRHYYVDNSGEMPERVHFEVRDAREPLPYERVRQLLSEIEKSLLSDDEAMKAQKAPPPETVLKLIG